MELIVSIVGTTLCWKDRKLLKFFLVAFFFLSINKVYGLVIMDGSVSDSLYEMGYDPMGGLFKFLIHGMPCITAIGFYVFLLLGIARLSSEAPS
jgi:hypothetical protein